MQNILDSFPRPGEAAGPAFVRLVRAAAIALVVALPLVVTPWGEHAYSQVKSVLTSGLALTGVLGWIIAYLVVKHPRWQGTSPELAVWAFLLAVLLSSITSVDSRVSYLGVLGRHEGLFTICAYAAWYFIGVHFFGSERGFRSLAVPAAGAAAATIGYGVLQVFAPPLFEGEAFIKDWYSRLGFPRIASTLGSPLVFGGYLAFMLPLMCALAGVNRGRVRFFWLAAAFVGMVDIALTLTRAAWGATIVGMGIFILAAGRTEWRARRAVIAGMITAVLASALILVTVVATPRQIGTRVTTSVDTASGSFAQHLYIWERVVQLIRTRPLLGWGLETLGEVFPYDRESLVRNFGIRPVTVDRAHNDFLQVAVSIGIPGGIAYVGFWVLMAAAAVRLWRRHVGATRLLAAAWLGGLAAYLVQAQFSFSTVAITPLVWLMGGAVCRWEGGPINDDDPTRSATVTGVS